MAYAGYFLKVGDYTIPNSLIKQETLQITLNSQDLDSYRDANGNLHRQALAHKVPKAEFETKPLLTDAQMRSLMNGIQTNYTNATEKKANVTFYIPETGNYMTCEAYVPDITVNPYTAHDGKVQYNPTRIAFIGY